VTDVDSDFFDLGGHSLLAARLIARAQREFGVALSLATFLDSGRTVAELAAVIDQTFCGTDEITSEPPLHFIFPFQATAMSLRHFKARWGAAQPVHALIPEQPGGQFDLSVSVEQHASQILAAIRNRQPDGPLALVGYSFGGLLAYEVARQAVDAGQVVDWLCLLDPDSPWIAPRVRSRQTLGWRLRQLRQRPTRERLAKFAEIALRVLSNGALRDPNGFDLGGAAMIACRYRQPGHAVPLELFISEGFAADMEADLLGWDKTHRGTLRVHRLPGDHFTMLEVPLVEQLAHSMLESLREAQASTRLGHPVAGTP
jgi:thioesterase domain-containing protein